MSRTTNTTENATANGGDPQTPSGCCNSSIVGIHPAADFDLIANELDLSIKLAPNQKRPVKRVVTFKVQKSVLQNLPPARMTGPGAKTFWQGSLGNNWRQNQDQVNSLGLTVDDLKSLEIVLRVHHGTLNDDCVRNVPIEAMWEIANLCSYLNMNADRMRRWFAEWYAFARKPASTHDHRRLLWPCWYYDHAEGFMKSTKYLVYNETKVISDGNPTDLYQWGLPTLVIRKLSFRGQHPNRLLKDPERLNAARGRLRTIMFRGLWVPIQQCLFARCACSPHTFRDYFKHLCVTQVFPFEETTKDTSIEDMLRRLRGFSFRAKRQACGICKADYVKLARDVVEETSTYFEGMCLDCLDTSSRRDHDADYRNQLTWWNLTTSCRVRHDEPTWYFSFNGRREEKDRLSKGSIGMKRKRGHDCDED